MKKKLKTVKKTKNCQKSMKKIFLLRNVANIKERHNSLCIPLKSVKKTKKFKKKTEKSKSAQRSRFFQSFRNKNSFFHNCEKNYEKTKL